METFNVDFTGVESSGNMYYVEPGTYMVTIKGVTKGQSEGKPYPYLKWECSINDKPELNLNVITSLSPKALFKLKELMEAVGVSVPDGNMKINPTDYIGKVCMADIEDRTHEGKVYSNITKLKMCENTGGGNSIDDIL